MPNIEWDNLPQYGELVMFDGKEYRIDECVSGYADGERNIFEPEKFGKRIVYTIRGHEVLPKEEKD